MVGGSASQNMMRQDAPSRSCSRAADNTANLVRCGAAGRQTRERICNIDKTLQRFGRALSSPIVVVAVLVLGRVLSSPLCVGAGLVLTVFMIAIHIAYP